MPLTRLISMIRYVDHYLRDAPVPGVVFEVLLSEKLLPTISTRQ